MMSISVKFGLSSHNIMNFERDIWLVRYPLRVFGLWPEDSPHVTMRFVISILLNVIGAMINARPLFFINNEITFLVNMSFSLSYSLITIKMYIMKRNKTKFMIIINWMNENMKYYKYLPEKSQAAMCKQILKAKRLFILIHGIIGLTLICLLLGPTVEAFIKNTSIMKISKEGWFSFHVESLFGIAVLFIIRALSSTCAAFVWSSIDCCIVLIILHICGQISVLCNIINNYTEYTKHIDHRILKYGDKPHYCNCLQSIIDLHNSILEISITVENFVNLIIFTKLLVQGAQICTVGFLLITNNEEIFSMIAMNLAYFMSIMWTIFIYGWLGEQLIQHGYAIGDAVYANHWYKFRKPKIRRTLSVIICRAQRKIQITAGKYLSMSLNVALQTIITGFSYLSVLNAVKSSQK